MAKKIKFVKNGATPTGVEWAEANIKAFYETTEFLKKYPKTDFSGTSLEKMCKKFLKGKKNAFLRKFKNGARIKYSDLPEMRETSLALNKTFYTLASRTVGGECKRDAFAVCDLWADVCVKNDAMYEFAKGAGALDDEIDVTIKSSKIKAKLNSALLACKKFGSDHKKGLIGAGIAVAGVVLLITGGLVFRSCQSEDGKETETADADTLPDGVEIWGGDSTETDENGETLEGGYLTNPAEGVENPSYTEVPKLDENGNPVLDESGEVVYETQVQDPELSDETAIYNDEMPAIPENGWVVVPSIPSDVEQNPESAELEKPAETRPVVQTRPSLNDVEIEDEIENPAEAGDEE